VKLPRDLSGRDLAHALRVFGYAISRESGSHLRLTTMEHDEQGEVATHFQLDRAEIMRRLFG
jgi:predicted RNA binding protein YcfA (HicA-like mRNA interferase family)